MLNREIGKMMRDFMKTRESQCPVVCITPTRVEYMELGDLIMEEMEEKEQMGRTEAILGKGYRNRIAVLLECIYGKAVAA